MAGYRRRNTCRVCGASWPYVYISARGLCPDHTKMRQDENLRQLRERSGPYFKRWRESMAACVGGSLVDARTDER